MPYLPVPPLKMLRAVAPERQVHVPAVADALGLRPSARTTRAARCRTLRARIVSRTRTNVSAAPTGSSAATDTSYWPAAVLGVDLVDRDALALEGDEQVAQVVRAFDQPRLAVRRPERRRCEVRVRGRQRPLDLERHACGVPGVGECGDRGPGGAALILRVHGAVLPVPDRRCPGPAGLSGQHGDPGQVGMQAEVTDRSAGMPSRDDRVVGQERVEDRRRPDAPAPLRTPVAAAAPP